MSWNPTAKRIPVSDEENNLIAYLTLDEMWSEAAIARAFNVDHLTMPRIQFREQSRIHLEVHHWAGLDNLLSSALFTRPQLPRQCRRKIHSNTDLETLQIDLTSIRDKTFEDFQRRFLSREGGAGLRHSLSTAYFGDNRLLPAGSFMRPCLRDSQHPHLHVPIGLEVQWGRNAEEHVICTLQKPNSNVHHHLQLPVERECLLLLVCKGVDENEPPPGADTSGMANVPCWEGVFGGPRAWVAVWGNGYCNLSFFSAQITSHHTRRFTSVEKQNEEERWEIPQAKVLSIHTMRSLHTC